MTSSQIFISYAEQDKAQAQRLYKQLAQEKILKQENISLWFEPNSLLAGQNREAIIRQAIQNSRLFLALLPSNSVQIGEFNRQLVQALDISTKFLENDIYIIPVRLNNCKFFHTKLQEIHTADMFLDWDCGFKNILKSIRQAFKIVEKFHPPISKAVVCEQCPDSISFIKNLFNRFDSRQTIILLAQEGRHNIIKNVRQYAEIKFGKQNVFHIVPPPGSNIESKEYFSLIAGQCSITKGIDKRFALINFFQKKIKNERIFLLITRFEHSCSIRYKELIDILDTLSHQINMNILICGGEKLENQFFDGIFDGLDLEICELPDLNLRDIKYKCSDDEVAEAIWQISGGHPKIIEQCIHYYFKYNDFKINECRESIMHLIPVIQLFTPFRKLSDDVKQQLCCLIKKDILPYYETGRISNSLIKL